MAKRMVATLLTDFGLRDPYVAAMKGVILSGCGRVQLVDISHEVPPQDVLGAALILGEAARYFPPRTLHVVVVDPGVGTERRILAARYGDQRFLFPDNGVITWVDARLPLEEMVVVRNTQYLPAVEPSMTFHGRDIFAPVAAHILNGLDIRRLGPRPETYKLLEIPTPVAAEGRIAGEIIYVDAFGNLISNIPAALVMEHFDDLELAEVACGGQTVGRIRGTYDFVKPGEPLALFNSMRLLEVAVNRGRADQTLHLGSAAAVRVAAAPPGKGPNKP